MPEEIDEEGPM
jgi:hypothetical protein